MLYFYKINGYTCCSEEMMDAEPSAPPTPGIPLIWLFNSDLRRSRSTYKVTDVRQMMPNQHELDRLNLNTIAEANGFIPYRIRRCVKAGTVRAVNTRNPAWKNILMPWPKPKKRKINILGSVEQSRQLVEDLKMYGTDIVESVKVYEIFGEDSILTKLEENLLNPDSETDACAMLAEVFNCNPLVLSLPGLTGPANEIEQSERMKAFKSNKELINRIARLSRRVGFHGNCAIMSNFVDPLCKVMFYQTNRDESGRFDGKGLQAEQIQGYGLSAMEASAYNLAQENPRYAEFAKEGCIYGDPCQGLVVANSVEYYDDILSKEMTEVIQHMPVTSNAFSSGAINLLKTIRNEWHYGSVYVDGVYIGCKNRYTEYGQETELAALPKELFERIEASINLMELY